MTNTLKQQDQIKNLVKSIHQELSGYDFSEDVEDVPVATNEPRYLDEAIQNLTDALAALKRQPGRDRTPTAIDCGTF